MMITGKVLDWQDDIDKHFLRKQANLLPKLAADQQVSSPEVVQNLPDDYFGLILHQDGERVRKFPLFTAADSWMAAKYFFSPDTVHLPIKARCMLGVNIVRAINRQSLEDRELKNFPEYQRIRDFLDQQDEQARHYRGGFSNVFDADQEDRSEFNETSLDSQYSRSGGLSIATDRVEQDSVSKHALIVKTAFGKKGVWRIQTEQEVALALDYFEKNANLMVPTIRREFALNTLDQADALGIVPNPDSEILHYGGTKLASSWKNAFECRIGYLRQRDQAASQALEATIEKVGSGALTPEQALDLLYKVDQQTGLAAESANYQHAHLDPALQLMDKRACSRDVMEQFGDVEVTQEKLTKLARNHRKVANRLSEEIANEFATDPVATYRSSPTVVRKVLAQMF